MTNSLDVSKVFWEIIPTLNSITSRAMPFHISELFLKDVNILIEVKRRLLLFSQYSNLTFIIRKKTEVNFEIEFNSFTNYADSLFMNGEFRAALSFYFLGFFFDSESLDIHQWALKGIARCLFHGYAKSSPYISDLMIIDRDLF